jgi:ABC-type antimicrobial peptide transport system permease subunit
VAIVSESLARQLWPGGGALGHRIRGVQVSEPDATLGPWRTVVGVARDVRQTYSDADFRDVYFPFLQAPTRFGSVQVRTDRASGVSPSRLAELVAELDPFVRVGEPTLLATEDRQFSRARFMAGLVGAFAGFATFLALLGIYGVTAYAVRQREREIAIRVALGATHSAVVRMFVRDAGVVLGTGVFLGLCATVAAGGIINAHLHGVGAFDPLTLAAACIALVGAGMIATWWPARQSANADVAAVLKAE